MAGYYILPTGELRPVYWADVVAHEHHLQQQQYQQHLHQQQQQAQAAYGLYGYAGHW